MALTAQPQVVTHSIDPLCAGPEIDELVASFITPADVHYVRNHGHVPFVDTAQYRLRIDGLVGDELDLSLAELQGNFRRTSRVVTLQCAGNRRAELNRVRRYENEVMWTGDAVGTATWTGVLLRDVLWDAGVKPTAMHVWFEGLDAVQTEGGVLGFGSSIDLERAESDDVLLAYEMNGMPIPAAHGAPLRVVIPGVIGARSVKWLARITLADRPSPNPFQETGYRFLRPGETGPGVALHEAPLNSFICAPRDTGIVVAGAVRIRGYATGSGLNSVTLAEISIDGGEWRSARLLDKPSAGTWVRWEFTTTLSAGSHEIAVRATDETGTTQSAEVAERWNVRGYLNDGVHRIKVRAGT